MASMRSSSSRDNKTGFWKKSINTVPGGSKAVYGAQHPPPVTNVTTPGWPTQKDDKGKNNKRDSFREFEHFTSDAWDDGDDDLIQMANLKLSLKDVQSSAKLVIDNHSKKSHSQRKNHTELNCSLNTSPAQPSSPYPSHRSAVGARLSGGYQPPKLTSIRYVSMAPSDAEATRIDKFKAIFAEPSLDLTELRKLCWSGIPNAVRPTAWKILSGYLPTAADRRQETLERKRKEYFGYIEQYYETRYQDLHEETFRQIHIDILRMNPLIPIFQQTVVQEIVKDIPRMTSLAHLFQAKPVQEIFERILYIWAIRHPASGYVQGINDLVTPFFVVFLLEYIENVIQAIVEDLPIKCENFSKEIKTAILLLQSSKPIDSDIEGENCDLTELSQMTRDVIEADSFWCVSKLLDGIQDNYTFAQPGIQMKVNALRELIKRIDAPLYSHLESQSVEFLQFSFRWMNNLLMREIPLRCTIRLWDTYQSEINGFADFHLYVCAAFLKRFSDDALREHDFQGILMLLQNLPTLHWRDKEISELLAEAYKLKYMFADAPRHLLLKS